MNPPRITEYLLGGALELRLAIILGFLVSFPILGCEIFRVLSDTPPPEALGNIEVRQYERRDGDNASKQLIILGSDHETDVVQQVTAILEKEKPDAISLEMTLGVHDIGELISYPDPKGDARKQLALKGSDYEVEKVQGHYAIKIGDWYLFNHPKHSLRSSEFSASVDYAIEHDIPIFFTDKSSQFPGMGFKFHKGKMTPLDLTDMPPSKTWNPDGLLGRNEFAAHALGKIYQDYDRVAHTGGILHFMSLYGGELQKLAPAGKSTVYNLVPEWRSFPPEAQP